MSWAGKSPPKSKPNPFPLFYQQIKRLFVPFFHLCFLLHVGFFWVSMHRHTHKNAGSTWSHAPHVKKSPYPRPNRPRETLQQTNRKCSSNLLVAPQKTPHPHKEKKPKTRKMICCLVLDALGQLETLGHFHVLHKVHEVRAVQQFLRRKPPCQHHRGLLRRHTQHLQHLLHI